MAALFAVVFSLVPNAAVVARELGDCQRFVLRPTAGQVLSGVTPLQTSSDCGSSGYVYFYVDGSIASVYGHMADCAEFRETCAWNTAEVANGPHTLSFEFPFGGPAVSVPVSVVNAPPTVRVTAPTEGSKVSGLVTISADAGADPSGGGLIDSVEFRLNLVVS